MGFGSGYSSRSDHGGKRYDNSMTAHVWNAQSTEAGQSGNGNLYFRGRAIYSYGSHYLAGFIMPDGVAFLNGKSYSVSTSGHMSAVRSAVKNRRTFTIDCLTDIEEALRGVCRIESHGLDKDERTRLQTRIRHALATHAIALTAIICEPGAHPWSDGMYDDDGNYVDPADRKPREGLEAGAYLAAYVGLPATSWPRIKREAAKLAAAKLAAKQKADADAAEKRALWLADMPSRDFREWIARLGTEYSDSAIRGVGKELRRARKMMLATKSGKLAAAGRLATIRDRIKRIDSAVATFDEMQRGRQKRQAMSRNAETLRNWRNLADHSAVTWHTMENVRGAAGYFAKFAPIARLRDSAAILAAQAKIGADAIEAETARVRAIERAEREARQAIERANAALEMAERIAKWKAGEPVGRVSFDADSGGAAMRIVGDQLETSHGATVPLAHAIKAFRFVKLMRERGESWKRNGVTIRVGHFQVDSISASGDFVAGCHNFTWPEVERIAAIAGVADATASADAVESTIAFA